VAAPPLVGDRVRFGNHDATVARVVGDWAYLVLDAAAELVIVPRADWHNLIPLSDRVHAAKQRTAWKEATFRLERIRPQEPARLPQRAPRAARARRVSRQVARTTGSRGDPSEPGGDPDPEPLARFDGFAVANRRMHEHLIRRIGARKAAAA